MADTGCCVELRFDIPLLTVSSFWDESGAIIFNTKEKKKTKRNQGIDYLYKYTGTRVRMMMST